MDRACVRDGPGVDAMKKRGITERQLDKIMSGNALRVIRDAL